MVAHADSVGLRLVADKTGLTSELWQALARKSFAPVHDRGRVLVDVAVMLVDGGEAIADIDVLRHQSQVLRAGRVGADGVAGPWTRFRRGGRRGSEPQARSTAQADQRVATRLPRLERMSP